MEADESWHYFTPRHVWLGVGCGGLAWLLTGAGWYAYSSARFAPTGSGWADAWGELDFASLFGLVPGLCLVLAMAAGLAATAAWGWRNRTWPWRMAALIACTLSLVAPCAMSWTEHIPFQAGLNRTMSSGAPIVSALAAFRADRGGYPEALTELVPTYLVSIPGTGLANYPGFRYARSPEIDQARERPAYELRVFCDVFMGFDSFVYWPEENYPTYMHGGFVERIGQWAYVHE